MEWYDVSAAAERTASRGGNCRLPSSVSNASDALCQRAEREALPRWRVEAPCRRDRLSVTASAWDPSTISIDWRVLTAETSYG